MLFVLISYSFFSASTFVLGVFQPQEANKKVDKSNIDSCFFIKILKVIKYIYKTLYLFNFK
jgi:hypothetical protein